MINKGLKKKSKWHKELDNLQSEIFQVLDAYVTSKNGAPEPSVIVCALLENVLIVFDIIEKTQEITKEQAIKSFCELLIKRGLGGLGKYN